MDMISIMHQGNPYGHLTVSNKPMSTDALARIVGATPEETNRLLSELEDVGIFSRTEEGVIYCRRMVRDNRARIRRGLNGGKGGNPALLMKSNQANLPLHETDDERDFHQETNNPDVSKEKQDRYETVMSIYQRACVDLPQITKGAPATQKNRKDNIWQLWETLFDSYHVVNDKAALALIERVFSDANKSDFLKGRSGKSSFIATFDWLVTPKNFVKVLDGNYANQANQDAEPGDDAFNTFWNRYPENKRTGKVDALKVWRETIKEGIGSEVILALDAWIKTDDWQKESGKYVPSPKNFLLDGKWQIKPTSHSQRFDGRFSRPADELCGGFHGG